MMNISKMPDLLGPQWAVRQDLQKKYSVWQRIRGTAALPIDFNTIVRGSLNTAGSVTSLSATLLVVANGSAAVALLGVPVGLIIGREGWAKLQIARDYEDKKGVIHSFLRILTAIGYTALSLAVSVKGVLAFCGIILAGISSAAVLGVPGLILALALIGYSLYGLKMTARFEKAMTYDDLLEQVSVTEAEGATEEARAKILQRKWSALERVVGIQCANEMVELFIHNNLENNPSGQKSLIEKVNKALFKEKVRYKFLLAVGCVLALTFIVGFLTPLLPLLVAISMSVLVLSALIWIAIDCSRLQSWIGDKLYLYFKQHQKPTSEMEGVYTKI